MVGALVALVGFAGVGFAVTALVPFFSGGIGVWSSLVDTALPVYSSQARDATLFLCFVRYWLARLCPLAPCDGLVVGQPQAGERGRPVKTVCNAASSGWACLRSVAKNLATRRKQGQALLAALEALFTGQSLSPVSA